eukprot:scaffold57430_cov77-Cyclotella_meneghiniana.AAC.3
MEFICHSVEEQQIAVYDSLKAMCDALGRPDIHRKMIENHRFAMVVDTNHLAEYRKAKALAASSARFKQNFFPFIPTARCEEPSKCQTY